MLEGKVAFDSLGTFDCGARKLEVFYYSWEESNPPGLAIHASYRILFMAGTNYLGSYHVQDRPERVTRTAIVFNYPQNDGNAISCDGGKLPDSVLLNGEGDIFLNDSVNAPFLAIA